MDSKIDISEIRRARRKRVTRVAAWGVPVVAAIALGLYHFGGAEVRRSEITISEASSGPLETTVAASGRVAPAFEEIVSSPIASRIVAVFVQSGDSVRQGTPLLQLDLQSTETQYRNLRDAHQIRVNELRQLRLANRSAIAELEMQVKIKEMEVNTLAIEVADERRLDSIGSGTGERVRRAQTAYDTGLLQLGALRRKLSDESLRFAATEEAAELGVGNSARDLAEMERLMTLGRIPSPHDGILTYLNTSIGSTVAAGDKLAVVGDLSRFRIIGEVAEGSSYKVRPGAEASVRIGNLELDGSVASVEPQSVGGAVQFTVALTDASNGRLRPGLRTQVYVTYGFKESAVRIPNGDYFSGPGQYTLFVAEGSRLTRRKVTVGDSNRQWVEVVEGIIPGESVVTSDMQKYTSHKTISLK